MSTPFVIDRQLAELVSSIAVMAGKAALAHFKDPGLQTTTKEDASPVTAADLASQRVITTGLARITPDIPIVSEESDLATSRAIVQSAPRFWLVDPLDGTREFIAGSHEFCVCIALIEHNQPVLGIIRAPALNWTYAAVKGQPCLRRHDSDTRGWTSTRARPAPERAATFLTSRSHGQGEDNLLRATQPEAMILPTGSAWKYCLIASGDADVAARRTPTSLWDVAAAACILECAGGAITDWDGAALRYDRADLLNPPFIAVGDPLRRWREALRPILMIGR